MVIGSSIIAYHYPHETLAKFFRLCFNYGLGRCLLRLKHKSLLTPRQLLFVACALAFLCVGGATLFNPLFTRLFLCIMLDYGGFALLLGWFQKASLKHKLKFFVGLVGAHICWLGGLINGSFQYYKDLRLQNPNSNP